jgi:methyl-accepting chemotaxis protein
MKLKDLWSKTNSWLQRQKLVKPQDYQPQLDDQGLISEDADSADSAEAKSAAGKPESNQVVVKAVQPGGKTEPIEKLQEGFNRLIEQLEGINEHLSRQAAQHENLMNRIDKWPEPLESFLAVAENQKHLTEQLFEQLKATATNQQEFIEAVERIPAETARQTDQLVDIDHQLAAAADADVQMAESFNNFNQTLDRLNQSTLSHTNSIIQMSKTFATSDRYLKYIVSRQNKRLMWIFAIAIGVCAVAILILTGVIIYLKQ